MKAKNFQPFFVTAGLSLLLFVVFVQIYLSIYKEISIRFWDEQAWIGRSYYFDLLIQDDSNNPLWKTYFGYNQPKLGEYLYGAILYPDYLAYKKIKDVDYIRFLIDHNFYEITEPEYRQYKSSVPFIDWGKDPYRVFDVTEAQLVDMFGEKIRPTVELIYKARIANVLVLSMTVVVAFLLTRLITETLVAFLTSVGLGVNFLFVTAGLRVHAEGLFVFFFLLTLYFFFLGLQLKKPQKKIWVFLGISAALTTQTKLNGIMLLFFTNLIIGIEGLRTVLRKHWTRTVNLIDKGFVINIAFILSFIVVHPFLYQDPIVRTLNIYRSKNLQAQEQTVIFSEGNLPTFQSRIGAMYGNFIFKSQEHCHFNGIYFLNKKACSINLYFYIKMILFIWGVCMFAIKTLKNNCTKKVLFLTCFFFINIITGLYLVLNWDRYFIHLIYFFIFFQVYGAIHAIKFLLKRYADNQLYKAVLSA